MVVKRRDRYVAFEVSEPRLGRDLTAALHEASAEWPREVRPQILFIQGRRGLVRCTNRTKEDVVRMLNSLRLPASAATVRTIGTSGTIRRARLRYFPER